MKMPLSRSIFAATIAAVAAGATLPSRASTFTVGGSGGTFTVTRSDTNAAETVRCRAVSRSALAGLHFMGDIGRLDFAAGERSKSVSVTEHTAAQINDPRFTYYQSNRATGNSRTYLFEVTDDGGFPLASADRTISYDASKSVSSATFEEKSVTVTNGEITVKDTGFAQAYHAVPLASYFSSNIPQDYLAASGANLRMLVDLQAAEVEDGYQYIQILVNQTSNCDAPTTGSNNGDPGTVRYSRYMAGFEHLHGDPNTNFKKYTFPVVSTNDGFGATQPWSGQGNDIGNLVMQRFNTDCRAADGRLAVPASLTTLGIRFTASGSDNDNWKAKSVVAHLQAVPAGPSLLNVNPAVTPAPVCKGSVVSVSLPFNEIVTVTGTPTLSTTWGNLAYVAGSGANVLTFAGPVTAADGTQLRLTGLTGTVKGLTGTSFVWSGRIDVSGRTVDSLSAPPREGLVYQLSTSAHLLWFADRLATVPNTSAALAADIDLSNVSGFVPMGGANGFMGTFDGRGHVLSGLSVSSPASPAAPTAANPARYGLFGQIAAQGVVSNLVLSGATVTASLNPALVGAVCGRNLGTIALCSVSGGKVSAGPRYADGTGTALGGVCGENAGVVRACRAVAPLANGFILLDNRVKNDVVGGIAGTNAVSGTLESSYFHALFDDATGQNITRGAVCGSNAGTIRRCVGLHDNNNYFSGAVGLDAGTVEDTLFPDATAFSGGEVCYALNGGVTDGSQPWYQALGTDDLPLLVGPTVYPHGTIYCNEIVHDWRTTWEHSPDYSNGIWTAVCSVGHETNVLNAAGTAEVRREPTCTEPGQTTWTYVPPANDCGVTTTNVVLDGVPPALGHAWGAPVWNWTAYLAAASVSFHCSRCDFDDTVSATVTRIVDGTNIVGTATVTRHGETFTDTRSVAVSPWKALQVRLDLGGTVTLTNDVTATDGDTFLTVTSAVTLDLNGHTLDAAKRFRVIAIRSGGNLTLTNSIPESGAITGGKGSYGGGVYVANGGTFEMAGGAISVNTAWYGGGVYVDDGGTFEMTGGEISGNTADYGGGVYIYNNSMFTLTGGEISGNTASNNGGGVYMNSGRFTVSGSPVVSGSTNSVGAADNVCLYSGHTIAVNGLSDGARIGVTTKTRPTASAPVTFTAGAAAGDSVYFFSDRPSVFVREANGEMVLSTTPPTPWERLQYRLDAGGTVTLTNDVAATDGDASLTVTSAVTLDLNGHTLTHNGNGQALSVGSGGDLTLTNSLAAGAVTGGGDHGVYVGSNAVFRLQGGAIAGNESNYAGGGVFVDQFGMFEMTGGTITNNAVTGGLNSGGGVYVNIGGTFEMTGGAISGNSASSDGGVYVGGGSFTLSGGEISGNTAAWYGGGVRVSSGRFTMTGGVISGNRAKYGGGVEVASGGTFEMTGGAISTNTASSYGGGVYVYGGTFEMTGGAISGNTASFSSGGGVYVDDGGTFEMTGGEISGNTANCDGGGVYVYYNGTFEMSGGAISGNRANRNGGGVCVDDGGTFTVSDSPVVFGNTNSVGAANNVYLYPGRTIAVNGLSSGARIGVTTKTTPAAFAPVTFATGAAAGDAAYFFSDVSGFVVYRVNDALRLRPPTPWDLLQAQLDAGGTVTLTNDVAATADDSMLTVTNAVTLDLNGHTLTHNGNGQALSVASGGDLTLTNSLAAGVVTGGGDHGVYVGSNAVFRLQGGAIAGNESNYAGGGVFVDQFGLFEMTGGTITNNAVTGGLDSGGGVYVVRNGTFAMTGGAISGNTADDGGGVSVSSGGTFTMTGGAISGNTASSSRGGGVYVYNGGTFEMTGGAISGNTAKYYGGGVYVTGTFTMTGGAISGNTAGDDGGGVYVYGTFTVSGSPVVSGSTNSVGAANNVYLDSGRTIAVNGLSPGARIGVTTATTPTASAPVTFATGASADDAAYFFSDNPGFVVDRVNDALHLRPATSWEQLQAQLDAGGTVTLTNDVTAIDLDATLTITNAVTLDLKGHTIDAHGKFRVINVSNGGNLTLTNSVEGSGAITGGNASNGGGVYVGGGGTFEMTGGAISGNTASSYGGGVYVYDGTFEMTGGEISGNSAPWGGGVYVYGGTFEMTGGAISGNTANRDGGGVYVYGGTFEMTGGAISDNTAAWYGGGVCVSNGGTFTMNGGVIAGNTAVRYGGGVRVNSGTFTLNGGAISGNTADYGGGVYVYDGTFEMTGGEISGNTAPSSRGGGVYVYNGGTFEMTGGAISGNTAGDNGGGVYVYNGGTFAVSGSPVVSGSTNSVGAANNVCLYSGRTIAVNGLSPGARIGVTTETAPTASRPVTFATGVAADDVAYFFSDDPGCHVERDGSTLRLAFGAVYPAYLGLPADPTDDTEEDSVIRAKYDAWARRYGSDALGANEAAYLLDVAPSATPAELRIDDIKVGSTGATIRVAATAGGAAIDLSQINGVLAVATGDDPASLRPKAIPAANVSYAAGAATIFVPSSAGSFVQARILVDAPASR